MTRLPVGSSTVWVTGQLLWHSFTPVSGRVWDELARFRLCGLGDLHITKAFKVVEKVYKRTAQWLDSRPMRLEELGHVVGVSLMTGRARHGADWTKEMDNRCYPSSVISYVHPHTRNDTDGLAVLKENLIELDVVNLKRISERRRT